MSHTVRCVLALVALLAPGVGLACDTATGLEGMVSIPQCDPTTSRTCISGGEALYQATTAFDIPDVFTIALQTSPWRMYDAEDRIVTVEEMAAVIRAKRSETDRRVHLAGSWTAARPDGGADTLVRRLSNALDGVPVDGSDGFLWLSAAGEPRTTHQAFSVWKTGPYAVERGAEVLMPLVAGWTGDFEDRFASEGNAAAVVRAGVGHDVFMLCPQRARASFERAAGMGSAIGAYNAGLMHADAGDRATAIAWLEKARALGEPKAGPALVRLGVSPTPVPPGPGGH